MQKLPRSVHTTHLDLMNFTQRKKKPEVSMKFVDFESAISAKNQMFAGERVHPQFEAESA